MDYSIRFDKCYTWEEYGREDMEDRESKIVFQTCPSDSCSSSSSTCKYGGSYIVEMRDFVETYLEYKQALEEYNCQLVEENCECDDDAVDDEQCLADCYSAAGLNYCGDDENEFQAANYMECAQLDIQGDDDNGGAVLYSTIYCGENGDSVHLGIYYDDACSTQTSSSVYYQLTGSHLPYSSKSLVTTNCISCYNPYYEEGDDDAGGNADEMVTEMCATVYQEAGKCETDMNIDNPDTDACDYITRIVPSFDKLYNNEKSKVSNSDGFAWFFGFTTVVCLAVIGYLVQTSKKQSVINLSEQGGVMT